MHAAKIYFDLLRHLFVIKANTATHTYTLHRHVGGWPVAALRSSGAVVCSMRRVAAVDEDEVGAHSAAMATGSTLCAPHALSVGVALEHNYRDGLVWNKRPAEAEERADG